MNIEVDTAFKSAPHSPKPSGLREAFTFCRICSGKCGMRLLVDDDTNRIVDARGDRAHPMTSGYACIKGLQVETIHHGPHRLLHPLKRQADGSFAKIGLEQALDEIAQRIRDVTTQYGADALGVFRGTQHYANTSAFHMLTAFIRATRTRSRYSTMTIDQSAKWVAEQRLGSWGAGRHRFDESDVWLFVGYNPLVSVLPVNGFPALNPTRRMKEAKARGMKFIVIDPRRTETAHYADVHLQPYPGEDPTVIAGLLHIIFQENWEDKNFCAQYVNGFNELRLAVAQFTPDYVAQRAGIDIKQLHTAAELFAHTCKSGTATSGTGPSMAPRSNLAEHLLETLNVVCGRFVRAGEQLANPGAMSVRRPVYAEVIAPNRAWESSRKSRVRELGTLYGEKMSGALADEILTPGDGQLRCFIVDGGNPVNALPDRNRAIEALTSLDLLVCIDPYLSETAQLAHYILPPTLMLERPDLPLLFEKSAFPLPFAQYTPAVIAPPKDSEVVEDWYVFWAIARRLGLGLNFDGVDLDMENAPSTDDLLKILLRDAQIPLAEIRQHPHGKIFEMEPLTVQTARPQRANNRFEVMPSDIANELAEMRAELPNSGLIRNGKQFNYRLCVRRARDVMNTTYRDRPEIRSQSFNPLFMHPDDMATENIVDGARIAIESAHGIIHAVAASDATMRQGVVAMHHGWGGLDKSSPYERGGVSTNELIPSVKQVEPINSMPWFSAVPVNIIPLVALNY